MGSVAPITEIEIPLLIKRLKASDAWKEFLDYQFGWYWKLIFEEYDRGGYLPADIDELWRLAGARTKAYFQREGQSVLSRFHGRTADGLRIYHPVVLEILGGLSKKYSSSRMSSRVSFSLVDVDLFSETTKRIFEYYKTRFQKSSTYTLTEKRAKKCMARLHEVMRSEACDLSMAEEIAKKAIDNLAASRWHVDHGHTDWDQIFRNQEQFQKRVDFKPVDDSAFMRGRPADVKPYREDVCWFCNQPRSQCRCQQ